MKWAAFAVILASTAVAADSCTPAKTDTTCAEGKGHWIEDESSALKGGYTVIVRLCIDDGGNVLDMEVD